MVTDENIYIWNICWYLISHLLLAEYLVDGKILSAPVLQQGQTSRNIYLPQGLWHDARSNSYIEGPKWLADYPAPLDVLPYFIKDHVVDY